MEEKEVLEETALTVAENNSYEMSEGIFGGNHGQNIRKVTSLDLEDEEQADMLLNSLQDVDFKLNDFVDKEITVVGCYVVERPQEQFNEETGEAYTRYKHVVMLFDENGKSYVTGSNACYMSFNDIVSIKGLPTKENPLILKPIKVDADTKGHSWLKLKLVTRKDK